MTNNAILAVGAVLALTACGGAANRVNDEEPKPSSATMDDYGDFEKPAG